MRLVERKRGAISDIFAITHPDAYVFIMTLSNDNFVPYYLTKLNIKGSDSVTQ